MKPRAVVDGPKARQADLAAIHIARKALGWDEDTYRDVMQTVARQRSAGDLDFTGRKRFLAHLQVCLRKAGLEADRAKAAAERTPWSSTQRLLWSLWQRLADADLTRDRGKAALDRWLKRQCQVDRMEWLTDAQIDQAIEAAKQWLSRKEAPNGS